MILTLDTVKPISPLRKFSQWASGSKTYLRDWKRKKRIERGVLPRGKHVRRKRTVEEVEISQKRRKVYDTEYYKLHPYHTLKTEARLMWAARKRAKVKGLDFNLDETDIVIPTHCPILGIPLERSQVRGIPRIHTASLDRKDNTKGYIKGNVEVISWLANTMKNSATTEQLVTFSKEMLRRYGSLS